MRRVTGVIIACLMLCMAKSAASKTLEEFKEDAQNIILMREIPYTSDELHDIFAQVLLPDTQILFTRSLQVLFSPKFPEPAHSNAIIVNGWRCMYAKMAYGKTFKDKQYQKDALFQTLAFHKNKIAELDEALANMIQGFPCESCARSARYEFGVQDNDNH